MQFQEMWAITIIGLIAGEHKNIAGLQHKVLVFAFQIRINLANAVYKIHQGRTPETPVVALP